MNIWRWLPALCLLFALCMTGAARAAERREDGELFVVAVDNVQLSLPQAAGAGAYRSRARYGRSLQAREDVEGLQRDFVMAAVDEWPIELLGWHCALLRAPRGMDGAALLQRLKADRRVRLAQTLNQFQTLVQAPGPGVVVSADPYLPLQANLVSLAALPSASRSDGRGVTLALVDTGVAIGHPDLQGRRIERRNVVDGNDASYEADLHGTQLAGVMVATVNNGVGIAGIADQTRLLAIKACWHSVEPGRRASCNSFTLAQGMAAAVQGGAQLINLSLGGPNDPLLSRMAHAALTRGISIVGAAPEGSVVRGFPVDVPGVIAVASTELGTGTADELRAPGRDILTLTPSGHYDYASGSSLAAAQVTAIAALLLQHEPGMSPARLASVLRQSAGPGGVVNACAALASLRRPVQCETQP